MAAAVVKGRGTLGGVGGDQRELEVFGRMLRWTDDAVDKKLAWKTPASASITSRAGRGVETIPILAVKTKES